VNGGYPGGVRIYTKTGDHGETGLLGKQRVPKEHPRIRTYGAIDELNSFVGLLRAEPLPAELDGRLAEIQATLFDIGADLATPGGAASVARVDAGTRSLESWIDAAERELTPLRTFILPAGHREAALLHVLRTICRRVERGFWALARSEAIPKEIGVYLNRLSDLFFVWARAANRRHGRADVPWHRAPGC
jgi:cob(I)alamin adenosyltransferase